MELGYTPIFKLEANGKDQTDHIAKNLISLNYGDNDGDIADEMNIKIYGNFKRPFYEDKIDLHLGYKETELYYCGRFTVQNTSKDYKENRLSLSASGVDFNDTVKEKRNLHYKEVTLSQVCDKIAKRNGLKYKCDFTDTIKYIAQTDESDLSFLKRLAKKHGAVFSVKKETILFLSKTGKLPAFNLDISECSALEIRYANRTIYGSVKAVWQNTKENKIEEVTVGSKSPLEIIKEAFTSKEEAKKRCEAKLIELNQRTKSGSLTTRGRQIFAGGILKLSGVGEDNGDYSIKKVSHALSPSGYTINLEFENKGDAK